MDQGGLGQIRFRGQDATECEDFIAAILKHAFSQGKQRDDQWMADFAATCMANDALRWWSALDEEAQGSWKLLRRAMLAKYRPLFYGESGEEAEKFVRAVIDKAIDEGKQKDNEWIVTYASSCMAGEALRWYSQLDEDTQDTWRQLRQALLVQYPRGVPNDAPLNIIPTPPAAAPVVPAPKTTRRGRIRISSSSYSTRHYISKLLQSNNRMVPTSSIADALEVEWNLRSNRPQKLFIPDSQLPGYDVLGIKWHFSDRQPSSNYLGICAVDSQTNSTAISQSFNGRLLIDTWKLSPQESGDGTSTLSAMDGKEVLYPGWNTNPRHAELIWFSTRDYSQEHIAEMFLEPI